ncbi:MAG: cell division protein ZapB [Acidobacteria bacterium]|nr:cell division protein ZapB [Acidobacteriota bacterium]
MATLATAPTTGVDPIDRLEEKIGLLVQMVTRLRDEQAQAAEAHQQLMHENEMLRGRIENTEGAQQELDALRGERDVIRGRVTDMLSQLESI